jgi:cytochrome P450
MPNIPRDTGLDSTWAFLRDPYRFIFARSQFHQSPVFQTRLIPQGPGDPHVNHRCPGEGVAVALMSVAVRFLARSLQYEVPEQDLSITWDRLPALPRSHFVMRNARITM